ncbi:6-carboxytetrahydropterin synthase [Verrucomicrobia bacterium]|nr:6-carboxytetrahydropterin synthase [Verrucomicrobiota bacterium]
MPYRICKTIDIENGHMLSKHPDKCQFPHGHTRKVEFVLEADELDRNDMVCDFKIVKEAVESYLDTLDHAMCMNTDDPAYTEFKNRYGDRVIGFQSQDPTTEVIAKTIYDIFIRKLRDYTAKPEKRYPLSSAIRVLKVRVWETATSWAEYQG